MKRLFALILMLALTLPMLQTNVAAAQTNQGCNIGSDYPVVCRSYLNEESRNPRGLVLIIMDLEDDRVAASYVERILANILDNGGEELEPPRLPGDVTAIAHATPLGSEMHTALAVARGNFAIVISTPGPEKIDLDLHEEVYTLIDDAIIDGDPLSMDILPAPQDIPGDWTLSLEGWENVEVEPELDTDLTSLSSVVAGTSDSRGTPVAEAEGFEITDVELTPMGESSSSFTVTWMMTADHTHRSVLVRAICLDKNGDELGDGYLIVSVLAANDTVPLEAYIVSSPGCVDVTFEILLD